MHSNNHYSKHLRPYANKLRKNMTKAETCLWKYALSKKQMGGFPFRRQRPIDQYIVDFVCLPLKLVIEVDGITHTYPEVIANDKKRQEKLESLGFKVIRFTDDEVLTGINHVFNNILHEIEQLSSQRKPNAL